MGVTVTKHTKWKCPGCKKKLTTLPTATPPTHRCTTKTTKVTAFQPM